MPIIFTNVIELSNWTYLNGIFTSTKSGKYLVTYTVSVQAIGGSSVVSVKCQLGGSEVIGSTITENLQSSSITQLFTNYMIINVTAGQTFSVECVSSTTKASVQSEIPVLDEMPISASVIIVSL